MLRGLYIFAKRVFFAFTIPLLVYLAFMVPIYYLDVWSGDKDTNVTLGIMIAFFIVYYPVGVPCYARVCAEHGIMGWDESIF